MIKNDDVINGCVMGMVSAMHHIKDPSSLFKKVGRVSPKRLKH